MTWVVLDASKQADQQEVFEGPEQEAREIAEMLNAASYCATRSGGTFYWPARYSVAEVLTP